jgi:hypothetical protein
VTRERRATFDQAADLYDRARPGYPRALFDDLAELTGVGAGSRILEIGPGTGRLSSRRPDPASVRKGLPALGQVRRAGQLTSSTPVTTATKPSANGPLRRSPRRRIASRTATTGFRLT